MLLKIRRYLFYFIAQKSINQLLFIVLFLETIAIAWAMSAAIAAGHSARAYFEEGGYMSILSCLQLLLGAFMARKIFLFSQASSRDILNNSSFFMRNVSYGLSFLTFDEAFQIHEYTDKLLHLIFKILFDFEETEFSDMIDDFIVGGYLLFCLIYAIKNWHTIIVFKKSFVYFMIGFLLTALMIIFDVASNNKLLVAEFIDNVEQQKFWLTWFATLEDSIKIYAEGLFLIGIYKCWRIAKSLA